MYYHHSSLYKLDEPAICALERVIIYRVSPLLYAMIQMLKSEVWVCSICVMCTCPKFWFSLFVRPRGSDLKKQFFCQNKI